MAALEEKKEKKKKMKKAFRIMAVLLALAVLMASCSNGGSSDGASSTKVSAVPVTLKLGGAAENIAQKAVALVKDNDSITYEIKAEPQWTPTGAIQNGKSTSFAEFSYTDGVSLGMFTPGTWKFSAQIKNDGTIIFEGNNTVVISPTNNAVSIDMELYNNDSTGSVVIKVAVPTVSSTKLYVSYDGAAEAEITGGTADTTVNTAGATSASNYWTYFTTTKNDLAPGNHYVSLSYKDGSSVIGGAIVAFTVRNGDAYGLYGTIENGAYQLAELTLTVPEYSLTPSAITYDEGTASITAIDGASYAWYVNGSAATAATDSNSYAFATNYTANGVYEVVCKVTKGDAIGFVSRTITIAP